MAKSGKRLKSKVDTELTHLADILYRIEPELRRLNAVAANLSVLSEAPDHVDPAALDTLAEATEEALTRVTNEWKAALAVVRDA